MDNGYLKHSVYEYTNVCFCHGWISNFHVTNQKCTLWYADMLQTLLVWIYEYRENSLIKILYIQLTSSSYYGNPYSLLFMERKFIGVVNHGNCLKFFDSVKIVQLLFAKNGIVQNFQFIFKALSFIHWPFFFVKKCPLFKCNKTK